jgi:DNA polymerase III epsilon subunit family exonuclease
VQLAIDALDRLVELVEEAGGRLAAGEAARQLLAVARASDGLARTLLGPLVEGDARLRWRGAFVALASAVDPPIEDARFVVFDLETTGLASASARICEIGAVALRGRQDDGVFETLVAPGVPLPRLVGRLTGLSDADLRSAPRVDDALRRFMSFAGDAVLVAHNARFDVGFVNRELARLTGKRLAAVVIDTVPLARALLRGRIERTSLASLAYFFGTSVRPCHRALPDAQATAEVFVRLVDLARERGATTLSELEELAAPRPRRIHGKRHLVHDAPSEPGVYLFRDRERRVLYVGKARELRARLRTYFQSRSQRPTVEAALDELDDVEWRVTGSELAAALEEVRLIRELRPPANTRTPQPERYVYLHLRGDRVVVSRLPSRYGPLRRRAQAQRAAQALRGCTRDEFDNLLERAPLERLRHRLAALTEPDQELEARHLRRRIGSLEHVLDQLERLERLKRLELRIVAPGLAPGAHETYLVCRGRVRPPGDGAMPTPPVGSLEPDELDRLLVVAAFLEHPPPELEIVPLGRAA